MSKAAMSRCSDVEVMRGPDVILSRARGICFDPKQSA